MVLIGASMFNNSLQGIKCNYLLKNNIIIIEISESSNRETFLLTCLVEVLVMFPIVSHYLQNPIYSLRREASLHRFHRQSKMLKISLYKLSF